MPSGLVTDGMPSGLVKDGIPSGLVKDGMPSCARALVKDGWLIGSGWHVEVGHANTIVLLTSLVARLPKK